MKNPHNRVALELERMDEEAKARTAAIIAAWRRRHPEATCNDTVAALLATMELEVGRAKETPWF